jgi:hypothetical protein
LSLLKRGGPNKSFERKNPNDSINTSSQKDRKGATSMLFKKFAMTAGFIFVCFAQSFAQDGIKPVVAQGVYWADAQTGVEVYLIPKAGQTFRLTVISPREVKVTYRTRINSVKPVIKELVPVATSGTGISYYEFDHLFSRMTIWMGLEFTVGGNKVPTLTRVFYNSIFETASSDTFLGTKN